MESCSAPVATSGNSAAYLARDPQCRCRYLPAGSCLKPSPEACGLNSARRISQAQVDQTLRTALACAEDSQAQASGLLDHIPTPDNCEPESSQRCDRYSHTQTQCQLHAASRELTYRSADRAALSPGQLRGYIRAAKRRQSQSAQACEPPTILVGAQFRRTRDIHTLRHQATSRRTKCTWGLSIPNPSQSRASNTSGSQTIDRRDK